MKKMISWNVNGLRAAVGKNFKEVFDSLDADIFAYRKQSFRKVKSTWNLTAIKAIGTMLKKRLFGHSDIHKRGTKRRILRHKRAVLRQ